MSIVRVSESTAFDSTTAPEAGIGATGYPTWVEGPNGAATNAVTAGTAHTKGAWVEVIAATSADADVITIAVTCYVNAADTATLLDIGIGEAGSETVLVPDIACGGAYTGGFVGWIIAIPVSVAAGTRIAVRSQGARTSSNVYVRMALYTGGPVVGTTATSLGTSAATSAGVEVGTSWTEIVASTAEDYSALVACPSLSAESAAFTTSDLIIGTGAAGFEVELARIPVQTQTLEYIASKDNLLGWNLGSIIPGIPAGTRIVAQRAQPCDVSFIGIT